MKKILDTLRNISAVITAVLFALIFCLILVEIFCRSFLGFSLLWYMDFVQLAVCWMLAFGMSAIVYTKDHLRIDFIKAKLSPAARRGLSVATDLLELAFFIMLVPYGVRTALTKMKISFTTLHWPMGYMFAALPVFGALCAVFMAWRCYEDIRALSGRGE